jgi:hypothetical protein
MLEVRRHGYLLATVVMKPEREQHG